MPPPLPDAPSQAQAVGIFAAGTDTTRYVLGSGLHLFANNPEQWRKIVRASASRRARRRRNPPLRTGRWPDLSPRLDELRCRRPCHPERTLVALSSIALNYDSNNNRRFGKATMTLKCHPDIVVTRGEDITVWKPGSDDRPLTPVPRTHRRDRQVDNPHLVGQASFHQRQTLDTEAVFIAASVSGAATLKPFADRSRPRVSGSRREAMMKTAAAGSATATMPLSRLPPR